MSSLATACIRERVLGYLYKIPEPSNGWDPQWEMTFDIGSAFHWWLQNDPNGRWFADRRRGWWQCLACLGTVWGERPLLPCSCGANTRAFQYFEHSFSLDSPVPVSGHTDMFLHVAEGYPLRIADFKSMKTDDFKKLKQPRGDHVIQLTGYMILAKIADLPEPVDTHRAFLVYIAKEHIAQGLPIKIFHVRRQRHVVRTVKSMMVSFSQGIRGKELPPLEEECRVTDWECYKARSCPAKQHCRGREVA